MPIRRASPHGASDWMPSCRGARSGLAWPGRGARRIPTIGAARCRWRAWRRSPDRSASASSRCRSRCQRPTCRRLAQFPGLADISAELTDFGETAALIANLDLVITVDTAMGHLAGAMGRPVWILLPKACDWRWMLQRSDSPWYPTARLFRQQTPGAWDPVIAEAAAALAERGARQRRGHCRRLSA